MEEIQYNETDTIEFSFKDTTATKKVFSLKKRIRAVAGGTSASKTISVLVWCIDYCQVKQRTKKLVHIVSESFPHLEMGAMLDFQNIMKDRGYWDDTKWHGTKHMYTFETGNQIRFLSVDTYGKAHGPRRDVLFVNEANNIEYKIVDQLITRTREIVWLDWNPSEEFWFYTEMLGKRQDVDFITLTYKDNEALDQTTIEEIESHKGNKNWWTVYGLGQLGVVEGRIYKDWNIVESIPFEARLERRGLDFGYSNDPTAIVAVYYYNGGYILDEEVYRRGLSNGKIGNLLVNSIRDPDAIVVADSAEPKSIDEIKEHGVNIIPAMKGQGSIKAGIDFVQNQRISVTQRSVNLIKEYRNYMWQTDKNDKIINEPEGGNDHCFIGNSLVTTLNGLKKIKNIKVGDKVLTSNGYKKVLVKHNNGIKKVSQYWLHTDMGIVKIVCTEDHKIKTGNTWTPISQLKQGMMVYLTKPFLEKNSTFIKMKDIFHHQINECIYKYTDITSEIYQKDSTYITRTKTHGIIDQKISNPYLNPFICQNTLKKGLKKIRLLYLNFKKKVLNLRENGIKATKVLNGIQNMENQHGLQENIENLRVSNVGINSRRGIVESLNSAIIIAKLNHLEKGKEWEELVYDLTVEDDHEYFVNGLLVHNCMDALRYAFSSLMPSQIVHGVTVTTHGF